VEEKNKVSITKPEPKEEGPVFDPAGSDRDIWAKVESLEARVSTLEAPNRGRAIAAENRKRQQKETLINQTAGLIATGEVTEEQFRNLPEMFTRRYVQIGGENWLDEAVALAAAAKAEKEG
jgi:hypothetical protein